MASYKVILFYRYVPIDNTVQLREQLLTKCRELSLLGRILLAHEGINGTLAGTSENVDSFISFMTSDERFAGIDWKDSYGTGQLPFPELSIKLVNEIVSSGSRGKEFEHILQYDPNTFGGLANTGKHLTAEEFHQELHDPNCIVLDIRNHFEYDIGHFEQAVNIGTYTYAETFDKLDSILQIPAKKDNDDNTAVSEEIKSDISPSSAGTEASNKKILMYCTGGVRCEKASAYLRNRGFDNVFHLQGGIHRYLQTYPDGGKFAGKNFVFDSRIAMAPDGDHPTNETQLDHTQAKVVGHCIDCQSPFDRYSGNIVCTVCRQPVLVCDDCVQQNAFPNEYYCVRHRDLKGIYLTILDNKSIDELRHQRRSLQELLDLSLKLAQEKKNQKIKQRQERSRQRHAEELQKRQLSLESNQQTISHSNHSSENYTNNNITNDNTHDDNVSNILFNENKHRRMTLRKQIQRLDEKIQKLEELHADKLVAEATLPNPKARCGFGFWNS